MPVTSPWRAFAESGDPASVYRAAKGLNAAPDDLLLVCVAAGGSPDLDAIASALCDLPNPLIGGLFPEVLVGRTRHAEGVLVVRLGGLGEPVIVMDFEDTSVALQGLTAVRPTSCPERSTAVVLVDGLAPDISRLLGATYNEFGSRVRYWGGGAGSLALDDRPVLFTRAGAFRGGAIIALTSFEARLGVHHGWSHYRGPLVATRTRGNRVEQLNWKNAAEVYGAAIRNDVGDGTPFEIGDFTFAYPLGIQRQDDEFIVRDPIGVDSDGALLCVGDVPENTVLSILQGAPEALIAAARSAAQEAARPAETPPRLCLIADCVSRVRYLGDAFGQELDAIADGLGDVMEGVEPVGVLTLGEISSRGDGYLELFNKTCVVAVLRER